MASSYEATVQEIRNRIDIVEVIGRHVPMKKAGASFKACCPFHREKTPSFHVHPHRQFYYCFGCGAKGDLFSFLMAYEGRSFAEVVKDLAHQLHIPLPEQHQEDPILVSARDEKIEKLSHLLQFAQHFFQQRLASEEGATARAYLQHRGLDEEIIARFGLGYAPDAWGALREELEAKQQDIALACEAGLLKESEQNKRPYDRFRHRITFPIWQANGRLVGFGGRALRDLDGAKYLNSPESPLFQKSEILYGLHTAHQAIRHAGYAFLVEGYLDVIAMHQHGFSQAIAALGTSFTEAHAALLKRYTQKVILLFDGDKAGISATERALALLLPMGFSIDTLRFPEGEDPDSYLQHHGKEAFAAYLEEQKRPAFDLWLQHRKEQAGEDPVLQRDAVEEILAVLRSISDPLLQDLYIQRMSGIFGWEESILRRQMMRLVASSRPREATRPPDLPLFSPLALASSPTAQNDAPPSSSLATHALAANLQEETIAQILLKSTLDCPHLPPPYPLAGIVGRLQSTRWRPILERFLLDAEEGAEEATLVASVLEALSDAPHLKQRIADAFFRDPPFQPLAVSQGYELILHALEEIERQRKIEETKQQLPLPSSTSASSDALSEEERALLLQISELGRQKLLSPLSRFHEFNALTEKPSR